MSQWLENKFKFLAVHTGHPLNPNECAVALCLGPLQYLQQAERARKLLQFRQSPESEKNMGKKKIPGGILEGTTQGNL